MQKHCYLVVMLMVYIIEAALENELKKGTFDIESYKSQFKSSDYEIYLEKIKNIIVWKCMSRQKY